MAPKIRPCLFLQKKVFLAQYKGQLAPFVSIFRPAEEDVGKGHCWLNYMGESAYYNVPQTEDRSGREDHGGMQDSLTRDVTSSQPSAGQKRRGTSKKIRR